MRIPLLARLESRIDKTSECWIWKGKIDYTGYGSFGMRENGVSRTRAAHKIVYEVLVGPIPDGMQLDHDCHDPTICVDNCPHRLCVNPSHLAIVTPRQNVLRSNGIAAKNAVKMHCLNGHAFDEANTYIDRKKGSRLCRKCRDAASLKYKLKIK